MGSFTHSIAGRSLAVLCACLMVTFGCRPSGLLEPTSGVPEFERINLVEVPGGHVNVAGGNLLIERVDMTIDTILGIQRLAASYNSDSGDWLWNFDIQYDGTQFTDSSGAVYATDGIPDGAAIPGSSWVRVDADTIATKGGLAYHFDASGQLDHVRWSGFDFPRIQYVRAGETLSIEQCPAIGVCSAIFEVALDANSNPTSAEDMLSGRRSEYLYDGDQLVEVRDPLAIDQGSPGTRYEYSSLFPTLISAVVNSEEERIEYAYQAGRRIVDVIQVGEGNPTHHFEFNSPKSYTDDLYAAIHTNPLGGKTRYHVDGSRRLHARLRGNDERVSTQWVGLRPVAIVAANGATTQYAYIGDDVSVRTDPSGNRVSYSYQPDAINLEDPHQRPIARIEDSLGLVEERTYDSEGRVILAANGELEAAGFSYNVVSVATATPPNGVTRSFPIYGSHGHWLDMDGGATPERRFFDAIGNGLVPRSYAQGPGVLSRGYDSNRNLNSLKVAATAGNQVISDDYITIESRSDGRQSHLARPGGGDYELAYDTIGRPFEARERVDGGWQVTSFEYDLAGNVTARERPNGMREEFEYDLYSRRTLRRTLLDGVVEGEAQFTYAAGDLFTVYDSIRGGTEVRTYDAAGRIATYQLANGESISFQHDVRSRVTQETYALAGQGVIKTLSYGYDLANRRVSENADGVPLITRTITDGQLTSIAYGNGLIRDFSYDPTTGLLSGTTTRNASAEVVESTVIDRTVEVNPVRDQTRTTTTTGLGTTEESYWLAVGGAISNPNKVVGKRVFGWEKPGSTPTLYDYDELSNLVATSDGDVFTYNAERNRLTSASLAGSTAIGYEYDEAGFVIERAGIPMEWTASGRMAAHGDFTIEWDMLDRLVSFTVGGVTRDFSYFAGLLEFDAASGQFGALDIGEVSVAMDSADHLYRHRDFRRNVSFVSDAVGNVVDHYQYGPYGVDISLGTGGNSMTFAGRTQVAGLMILGARMYDPAIGRFLSPDPISSLVNQYAYTMGNPIWYWDPNGTEMEGMSPGQGAAAATVGAAFATHTMVTAGATAAAAGGAGAGAVAVAAIGFAFGGIIFAFAIAVWLSSLHF